MPRKRFSRTERQLIGAGAEVDWQNVTQWHPGTIATGEIVTEDSGWQHVVGTNHEATRTIGAGATIWMTPGHIRPRSP